jgi:hypothetical protein
VNLNFGSYGAVPKQVLQKQQEWIKHVEANPDRWFRLEVCDGRDGLMGGNVDFRRFVSFARFFFTLIKIIYQKRV